MRVHINFEVLEKNGNEYRNYAQELNDIISNLNERKDKLSKEWISTNATNYDVMLDTFINKMKVDASRMQKYSDTILGINDDFKQTDLEYAKSNSMQDTEDIYGSK